MTQVTEFFSCEAGVGGGVGFLLIFYPFRGLQSVKIVQNWLLGIIFARSTIRVQTEQVSLLQFTEKVVLWLSLLNFSERFTYFLAN